MSHTVRRAVAAALTAAVAFGTATTATAAEPTDRPAQAQKQDKQKPDRGPKADRGNKADKRQQRLERQVLRQVDRVDTALRRNTNDKRLRGLTEDLVAAVRANADADRSMLADLETAVAAGHLDAGQLREARTHVTKEMRAENYLHVANALRKALRIQEQTTEGSEADLHAASAIEAALAVTAHSAKAELREVRRHLAAGWAAVQEEAAGEEPAPADEPQPEDGGDRTGGDVAPEPAP